MSGAVISFGSLTPLGYGGIFAVCAGLTALALVAIGVAARITKRHMGTPRREITGRVFEALRAVGLSARAQAFPTQLSQGEAQRAARARAIVRKPPLLLADEPTGNLDDSMAGEILGVVREIWTAGTTVLLVTHQRRLAATLRQRTLTLESGRLVKDEG